MSDDAKESRRRNPPGSGGYVLLHRRLLDHALMNQLPAAWFRVFIAILLKVNWKPGTWWDGRAGVTIPPGSFVTSLDRLAKISGASKRQTRGALAYLKAARTVTLKTTNQYTAISLVNWEVWQNLDEQEGTPRDTQEGTRTTHERHADGTDGGNNRIKNQNQEIRKEVLELDLDISAALPQNGKGHADARPARLNPRTPTEPSDAELAEFGAVMLRVLNDGREPPSRVTVRKQLARGGGRFTVAEACALVIQRAAAYAPDHPSYPKTFAWFGRVLESEQNVPSEPTAGCCRHGLPFGACCNRPEMNDHMTAAFDTL